jgi:hypothetical protein
MTRRASFRFLGDRESLILHDLDRENEEQCGIQELLRAGRGITFRPDSLRQGVRQGFVPCEICVGELDDSQLDALFNEELTEPRTKAFRDRAHPLTP